MFFGFVFVLGLVIVVYIVRGLVIDYGYDLYEFLGVEIDVLFFEIK